MKTVRFLLMLFVACLAALGVASPRYARAGATTTYTFHANASQALTDIPILRAPSTAWRWADIGPIPPPPPPW